MTHRDGFPRFSARSAWRGDVGHREPCAPSQSHGPSESLGKPPPVARANRQGRPGGRRQALTMPRIACGFPPARPLARRIARGFPATRPLARRIACPISMGHYQRSLVSTAATSSSRTALPRSLNGVNSPRESLDRLRSASSSPVNLTTPWQGVFGSRRRPRRTPSQTASP